MRNYFPSQLVNKSMKNLFKVTESQACVYVGIIVLFASSVSYVFSIEAFFQSIQLQKASVSVLTGFGFYKFCQTFTEQWKNFGLAQIAPHLRFTMKLLLASMAILMCGMISCAFIEYQNVVVPGVLLLVFTILYGNVFRGGFEIILQTYLIEHDPEMLMLNSVVGN